MKHSYPGINPDISDWKGQEITDFQEELRIRAKGQVSEKWFYTHIKAVDPALPRIDVLNLLSKFAGFSNWNDFKFNKSGLIPATLRYNKYNKVFIAIPFIVIVIMLLLYGLFRLFNTREYSFCFYDVDTKEPVINSSIEVLLLSDDESPASYICNHDGCFEIRTDKSKIKLVVRSPYYRTDTVDRVLKKFNSYTKVGLRANEYALMIHYFSQMKVEDWEKRRLQLNKMFDDEAVIYQVIGNDKTLGMELYSKAEFIDKLTMPSASLNQIEVLDTRYLGDRILILRFRIKELSK
ncbi:MAG: hypothetical protein U1C46_03470 [Bacteroidales bacterium]|nr:hypothetical protein [Bacteroidales bacterium]MDZ4203859.1 hypothetical protein [Bacteroidales bacterium]